MFHPDHITNQWRGQERRVKLKLKLDVRCKFLLLIIISIVGFSVRDEFYGKFVFFIIFTISFLMGQRKKAVKFAVVYIAVSAFVLFSDLIPVFIQSAVLIMILCLRLCLPIMLYGQTFLKTTAVSEMVTGMYAMHIPRAFVITFAVAMRFFPAAREEIGQIKDAMTLRGIEFSLRNICKRPMLVFEGLLTPLLVRASTVAEELSAASITRGLDSPLPRTAFHKLHITVSDILVTAVSAAALFGVCAARAALGR